MNLHWTMALNVGATERISSARSKVLIPLLLALAAATSSNDLRTGAKKVTALIAPRRLSPKLNAVKVPNSAIPKPCACARFSFFSHLVSLGKYACMRLVFQKGE